MYVIVPRQACQKTRELLTEMKCLDTAGQFLVASEACSLEGGSSSSIGLPITITVGDEEEQKLRRFLERKLAETIDEPALKISFLRREECRDGAEAKKKSSRRHLLVEQCKQLMQSLDLWTSDDLLAKEIPHHWEKHGDLILLPDNCLLHPNWHLAGDSLWQLFCRFLNAKRVAQKSRVTSDDFRSPRVRILHGPTDDTWVRHVDNGVEYNWDVTKCMFSAGNITEKLRVASFDCRGETVVDLFAGIGYFTLPYLVHAKAAFVHACEWNPSAAHALRVNLERNKVDKERYAVHEGDNRKVCPVGVADRVNLGLIPTSEMSYVTAIRALKPDRGGILHIHGNASRYLSDEECDVKQQQQGQSSPKQPKQEQQGQILTFRSSGFQCKYAGWEKWSRETAEAVAAAAAAEHFRSCWKVELLLLTHVKSYAPKVDHLVLDLSCSSSSRAADSSFFPADVCVWW